VSAPPSCVLWIDGVRYADGQPGEHDGDPVALTGLEVVWGRDTVIDQPAPASCTFTVLDRPGDPRFTSRLVIGARVQVRADAVIYPDPSVPIFTDPGFEAAPVGGPVSVITTNAAPVTVTTTHTHGGLHAVRVDPVDAGRLVRVIFPPAPLSASHDPGAWDAVPRTLPGETWAYGAAVRVVTALSPVARAQVHPVTFTQPWAGTERVELKTADAGAADAAGWSVHSALYTPPAGVWLGVAVDVYPTGPSWNDLPPALTWDAVDPALAWNDLAATYVDDLVLLAPAAGATRAGEVFTGRITDLDAQWDANTAGTMVKVTAQDDTAELANRYVGAAPWAAESLSARFGRILAAAGQAMQSIIDPGPAALPISYRDVDNQPAAGLLQSLAQSAGGVLWSATSLTTGPYLRLEDINARKALLTLTKGADGVVRIVPAMAGTAGVTISACDVLLDPVHWEQDIADVATRVAIGWKDQTPDPVKPADRTVTLVNTAAEAATGQRRVQLSTELATEAAATDTGNAVLARLTAGGWRIRGLTYRVELTDPLDAAGIALVMTILDATTRIGLPILLTDVPAWSPAPTRADVPLYLEGAVLTNTGAAWTLALVTSAAAAQGAGTVQWDQLDPTWTWDQFDPDITWNDLRGVGI
jgi:hypothetical protein